MTVTLSSHTLNGVDGTHAGGIGLDLFRLAADGAREKIFSGETDEGGRFLTELDLADDSQDKNFELVFTTAAYWASRAVAREQDRQILNEIVIRFAMPDPDKRYHIPVILSPNTYSVWLSG